MTPPSTATPHTPPMVSSSHQGAILTLMYAQEMGRMALEPQGAALMVPRELLVFTECIGTTGWLGRKGARWAFLLNRR